MPVIRSRNKIRVGDHVKVILPPYDDGRSGTVVEMIGNMAKIDYDVKEYPLINGTWQIDDLEVIP